MLPITTLLFLTASAALAQSATCDAPPLVVTRARMLGSARADREVVISDGRVVTAGVAGKLKRPPNARIIDARGDTLLPGLIDAHAHMYDLGGPSPPEMYSAPRENSFPITARQLLRSGVTTARVHLFDLVNGPALKRDATSDCFPSPRLQIGGPGVTGGQPEMSGAFFGGYRDVDDARAKLNAAKTAGADWIALHGLSRYPPGELEQISDEAHRLGLRVMAEGDPASRAERALAIGADSIEYLDRSVEGGYPAALVERLKNSNAYLVPPVGYFNRIVEMRRNQALSGDEMFTFFMPTEVAAGGAAAPGGIARQAGSYGRSSHEGQ